MRSVVAQRILNKSNKKKRTYMKENILRLCDKLIKYKSTHSIIKFDCYAGKNTGCRYLSILLIPSLSLDIDNQMNSTWKASDGTIYPSVVGVGMEIRWLIFYASFELNFKTNKPLEE